MTPSIKREVKEEPIDDYEETRITPLAIEQTQDTHHPKKQKQMPIEKTRITPLTIKQTPATHHHHQKSQPQPPKEKTLFKGSLLMLSGFTDSTANTTSAEILKLLSPLGNILHISGPENGEVILRLEGRRMDLALDFWKRAVAAHGFKETDTLGMLNHNGQAITGRVLTADEEERYRLKWHLLRDQRPQQEIPAPTPSPVTFTKGLVLKLSGFAHSNIDDYAIKEFFSGMRGFRYLSRPRKGEVTLRVSGDKENGALEFWKRAVKEHGFKDNTNTVDFKGQRISARLLTGYEEQQHWSEFARAQAEANRQHSHSQQQQKKGKREDRQPPTNQRAEEGQVEDGQDWQPPARLEDQHQTKKADSTASINVNEEEMEMKPFSPCQMALCIGWRLKPENHKKVETSFCELFPKQKPPTEREVKDWANHFLQKVATFESSEEEKEPAEHRVSKRPAQGDDTSSDSKRSRLS